MTWIWCGGFNLLAMSILAVGIFLQVSYHVKCIYIKGYVMNTVIDNNTLSHEIDVYINYNYTVRNTTYVSNYVWFLYMDRADKEYFKREEAKFQAGKEIDVAVWINKPYNSQIDFGHNALCPSPAGLYYYLGMFTIIIGGVATILGLCIGLIYRVTEPKYEIV